MNKLVSSSLAVLLCGAGFAATAQQDNATKEAGVQKHGLGMQEISPMDRKAMDSNGDGMISRKEYMRYHDSAYGKMKKGSNGMVSVQEMMHDDAPTNMPSANK